MKNSIKITTLATWTLTASLGAWGGYGYAELKLAAQGAPVKQEMAKANYAPKEYSMDDLVDHAINTQFVDIPQKPRGGR